MIQRLDRRESIIFINRELKKDAKFFKKRNGAKTITLSVLDKCKTFLKQTRNEKLYEIAREGFVNQHLERIQNLEKVLKEMWKCYQKEKDPLDKAHILWYIVATQPYLGQYHETTKDVMKSLAEMNKEEKENENTDSRTGSDNLPISERSY